MLTELLGTLKLFVIVKIMHWYLLFMVIIIDCAGVRKVYAMLQFTVFGLQYLICRIWFTGFGLQGLIYTVWFTSFGLQELVYDF